MRRKGHEHMIAIIDYDAGNIKSVEKAMHLLGQEVVVTRDRESILKADKVILPGVGAFGDAMSKIRQYNLEEVIHEVVEKGTPFLGICLGLQLLFERSDETPGVEGLGILKGEILRVPDQPGLKIPHMGWNQLHKTQNHLLLKYVHENEDVYFVHSYMAHVSDENLVAYSDYGSTKVTALVQNGNVMGCQFHPEKSGKVGQNILRAFKEMVEC